MRVEIDSARCQGHARCMENAPDVFGYDDITNIALVLPGADLDAHRAEIVQAAKGCPESAISVTEG